jgi:hypothetical protein
VVATQKFLLKILLSYPIVKPLGVGIQLEKNNLCQPGQKKFSLKRQGLQPPSAGVGGKRAPDKNNTLTYRGKSSIYPERGKIHQRVFLSLVNQRQPAPSLPRPGENPFSGLHGGDE